MEVAAAPVGLRPAPAARRLRLRLARGWPVVLAFVIVLGLVLAPLVQLVLNSFRSGPLGRPTGWTLGNYTAALTSSFTYAALGNTFVVAAAATVISVVLAILFAWLVERTDMPLRNVAWSVLLLPIALPGILFVLSWALLLSPKTGLLNTGLRAALGVVGLGGDAGPLNIYTLPGLIFLDGLRGVTTVFLMVVGAFRLFDPSLEEAASVSGARMLATVRRITVPVLLPALLAAAMYSFIGGMESFEAALAIGLPSGILLMSSLIYFTVQMRAPIDYGLGSVYAVIFMALMTVLVVIYRRVVARSEQFATVTGKGYRPRQVRLGRWRYPALGLVVLYCVVTVVVPFVVLLWTSLLPPYTALTLQSLSDVSFASFSRVLGSDAVQRSFGNTVILTLATATLTMAFAFVVSWAIVRSRSRSRGLLDGLSFIPYAFPGISIALAVIFLFLNPPLNTLDLYGTIGVLIVALTIQYIAFGTRLMNGAVIQVQRELEEAALVCGAGHVGVMSRITMPLLLPSLAAGWVWVAASSLRAFSIPVILASRGNEVVASRLWAYWDSGHLSDSAALGVLLMVVILPLSLMLRRLMARAGRGQVR